MCIRDSIVAGGLFILFIGYNPFSVYGTIVSGAFRSTMAFQATIKLMVPLLIPALGITLAFKMRFWNIEMCIRDRYSFRGSRQSY